MHNINTELETIHTNLTEDIKTFRSGQLESKVDKEDGLGCAYCKYKGPFNDSEDQDGDHILSCPVCSDADIDFVPVTRFAEALMTLEATRKALKRVIQWLAKTPRP